jgi:catechol 2,3-dioxygenase-like lactoylglutathione lyase family enzyme
MAIPGIEAVRIVQIGMVVKDAEQSAEQYRRVLGFNIPQSAHLTEEIGQTEATYYGQPMAGRAKIIAFDIGDIQFEFIEPVGEGTTWHDFLTQHGEGLHHFALATTDTTTAVEAFQAKGYQVIQQGYFGARATGGQYTYLNTDKDLGVVIELLQLFGERGERATVPHSVDKGLGTNRITQIGIIVQDIQASIARYVEILELPQAPIIETPGYERSKTTYLGENSEATAKLAFFNLGQVQIELIEPDAHPSVWREYLESHGEGAQHIAFQVKDTERAIEHLGGHGIGVIQQGLYADASGMYTYVDSQDQQAICLELLQNF